MIRNAIYATLAAVATGLALFLGFYSVIPTAERMLAHPLDTSAIVQPPTAEAPGSVIYEVDGTRYSIAPDLPATAWANAETTTARVFYNVKNPADATLKNPSPFISTMLVSLGLSSAIIAFGLWRLFFSRLFDTHREEE